MGQPLGLLTNPLATTAACSLWSLQQSPPEPPDPSVLSPETPKPLPEPGQQPGLGGRSWRQPQRDATPCVGAFSGPAVRDQLHAGHLPWPGCADPPARGQEEVTGEDAVPAPRLELPSSSSLWGWEVAGLGKGCGSPPPHGVLALGRDWADGQGETQLLKEVFSAGASPGKGIEVPQAIST